MSDLADQAMSLETARKHPRLMRDGEPVPKGTFIRWVYSGVRGHRLQTELLGGKRVVRISAIEAFLAALCGRPILQAGAEAQAESKKKHAAAARASHARKRARRAPAEVG